MPAQAMYGFMAPIGFVDKIGLLVMMDDMGVKNLAICVKGAQNEGLYSIISNFEG